MARITIEQNKKKTIIEIDGHGDVTSVVQEYMDYSPRTERVSLYEQGLMARNTSQQSDEAAYVTATDRSR